ncbi:hypothetical protein [Jiella mangrovi]|uniref:Uncharacterized protein n=1 Tax=Jiella mangrovi TaxID=2821407 RepID=A0ABS4BHK7_9HYPH|nr:hypothetical protein [Jiella mangrovi]MBP0616223.1 hypothetical protein [Jiella mangrovi]
MRFSGPAFLAVAVATAIGLRLPPAASLDTLFWWIAYGPLAPERAMPLAALGAAFGLIGWRARVAALAAFGLGIAGGFYGEITWLALLGHLPAAAGHDFYAGPGSCIAAGAALISGRRLRPVATPLASLVIGTLWALWIRLLDPTLHDLKISVAGVLVAVALIVAIASTVAAFRGNWMFVAAPICGSWLLAIGLLYGGSYLATKPPSLNLPPPAPARDSSMLDGLFPEENGRLDRKPGRSDPFGGDGAKPF